ncbi:MAG: DUF1523 family protein [Candidatus Nanoarchaeia archaeon]
MKIKIQKDQVVAGIVFVLVIIGFLWFIQSYFICDTIVTKITDAQMNKVDGIFMVATEYGPLQNHDAKYRFKFNSGNIQNEAIRLNGKVVRIKKYGWRIPVLSKYENIRTLKEVKE